MALPINIRELIHGKVVEWDRLEFKKGWNPEEVLHTLCAFANDINNWGGGYVVVGIETKNGLPQLPPVGLPADSLDRIQSELIQICYQMQPNYLSISQPYLIDDRHILIIWAPAGDLRPYSCPSTQGNDARRQYYIRSGSSTIIARGDNQTKLLELTAKTPFDDRINQQARLTDLDFGLIREYLSDVRSDLFDESINIPFADLCRQMQIARGPIEFLRPVNVGLMFFNRQPQHFFNRAWIELAIHSDDSGRNYISETFTGPLHHQIRNCLNYIRNEVIRTEVYKVNGRAESVTVTNYPFNALEEAVCNAVYHKSYAEEAPVEIQIFLDKIIILSYPGPMPPITNSDLQQRRVVSRTYRNRRIGDFLKELDLTEGKSTGFPVIRDAMSANGNPEPVFYTDDQQLLFMVTLPCHDEMKVTKLVTKINQEAVDKAFSRGLNIEQLTKLLDNDISEVKDYIRERIESETVTKSVTKIIDFLTEAKSRQEIFTFLEIGNQTKNFNTNLKPLIENNLIELTMPGKPQSKLQKYRLTMKGRKLLKQ
jgi:ATP-dependent DNA helicase RecG